MSATVWESVGNVRRFDLREMRRTGLWVQFSGLVEQSQSVGESVGNDLRLTRYFFQVISSICYVCAAAVLAAMWRL